MKTELVLLIMAMGTCFALLWAFINRERDKRDDDYKKVITKRHRKFFNH